MSDKFTEVTIRIKGSHQLPLDARERLVDFIYFGGLKDPSLLGLSREAISVGGGSGFSGSKRKG